jgi:IS30 family transposase
MSYTHLSLAERHYIEVERKRGESLSNIGLSLGRSQSTISREIQRNTGKRGYRHKQATRTALDRHTQKNKAVKLTAFIKAILNQYIKEDWSPEQIAGKLKTDGVISIHHETIYQYILEDKCNGGKLYTHLRHQNKTYRKRYGSAHNRTGIPNRTSIEERPEIVEKRERTGDWEADTIIGKNHKGAIVTMDERRTKLRLAAPLSGKKALLVKNAMVKLLSPVQRFVKTITFDNGKEFTKHEDIAKALSCHTYFARPYHSWERGQNENANGLLRQYFPKSMELVHVTFKAVMAAIDKLNSRPRKCLGYKTPYEAFQIATGIDVRKLMSHALMT